eukprot:681689-Pyramimonas_sp.AAC.1
MGHIPEGRANRMSGRGIYLRGGRGVPVAEGGDVGGDDVVVDASAHEGGGGVHAEDVGVGVVHAHHDRSAVHAHVGAGVHRRLVAE